MPTTKGRTLDLGGGRENTNLKQCETQFMLDWEYWEVPLRIFELHNSTVAYDYQQFHARHWKQ